MKTKTIFLVKYYCLLIILFSFFSCSDEFIISLTSDNNLKTNESIGVISNFKIKTGFTDSLPIIEILKISPELHPKNEYCLDSLNKRVTRFHLKWCIAKGADFYEIRAYHEKIDNDNWHLAQVTKQDKIVIDGNTISAIVPILPEVLTGKCIDCEAAYNPVQQEQLPQKLVKLL